MKNRVAILVLSAIILAFACRGYVVDWSYSHYISFHSEEFEEINRLLTSADGDLWVLNEAVVVVGGAKLDRHIERQLLRAKGRHGFYLISKKNSKIYYGIREPFGFDIGITFIEQKLRPSGSVARPIGDWFY